MSIPPPKTPAKSQSSGNTPASEHGLGSVARLIVVRGSRPGAQYALPATGAVLGRGHDAAIVLDDSKVSRAHAIVVYDGAGTYTIRDLGSSNGTFVNDKRVTEYALHAGDRIGIGGQLLFFSQHSEMERQLIEQQRLEALGRMTAGVVHDFNNMLAVVLANCDALRAMPGETQLSDAEVQECVGDIRGAAGRAHEVARRWLAFGRGAPTDYRPIDLAPVCREVCDLLRMSIPRFINIECCTEPELWVLGDGGDLYQVLVNLMINARDAMPDGGKLRVTATQRVSWRKTQITIEVADNGIGMDKATRARIFEPFFSTKQARGFGLGLATVHEIVHAHGGSIDVRSTPRVGTTFEIVLPGLSAAAVKRAVSSRPPVRHPPGRSKVVLVVDDEESVRRAIVRMLSGAGYELLEAADGREAVKRYLERSSPPDLVLLDLDMPVLDGVRTLALLRKLDPGVRVVACGGLAEGRREELLDLGAIGVLQKPFDAEDLTRVVGEGLGGPAMEEDNTQTVTDVRELPPEVDER